MDAGTIVHACLAWRRLQLRFAKMTASDKPAVLYITYDGR